MDCGHERRARTVAHHGVGADLHLEPPWKFVDQSASFELPATRPQLRWLASHSALPDDDGIGPTSAGLGFMCSTATGQRTLVRGRNSIELMKNRARR